MEMDTNNCIGCGKKIHRLNGERIPPWFCSEWCAADCMIWTYRGGIREPDDAMTSLALRHKETGNEKDLGRIERMLERLQVK